MTLPDQPVYDFAIIGSGFAGMCCAYILANEGYTVALIDKNIQLGGSLQIFSRDKCILDTGVHYIGGYDEGQNLRLLFRFLGLADKIEVARMDENGYDIISFSNGEKFYHAMGYDNFKRVLCQHFPDEEKAIHLFCEKIQTVCRQFPFYDLSSTISEYYFDENLRSENAFEFIASITSNKMLRNVLAGNNMLYAGIREKTPLYVHALIFNSYLCGSYKIVTGGAQLIRQMTANLRKKGVSIMTHSKVTKANYNPDGSISGILLESGKQVIANKYISAIHPSSTIELFGNDRFPKPWVKRVNKLEQTTSAFILQLTFKPHSFPYLNHNIYHFFNDDVWDTLNYTDENWPLGFFVFTPVPLKQKQYAESLSVMCYMKPDEVQAWQHTHNTTAQPAFRGETYEQFKRRKEQQVLSKLETLFPDIKQHILNVYSSTPLTFRDYTGSVNGSMYGILKNSQSPLATILQPKTKIPNLWLTGQNIVFHGILGTTISAFITCFEFTDRNQLIEKIHTSA